MGWLSVVLGSVVGMDHDDTALPPGWPGEAATPGTDDRTHPLLRSTTVIHRALEETEAYDPDFIPTADKRAYIQSLQQAQVRLQARLMRALAGAGDIAEHGCTRSAAHWLADVENANPGRFVAEEKLGARIWAHYPIVAAAISQGSISIEHARVVAAALDAIPADVPGFDTVEERAALMTKAEEHLVGLCAKFTPKQVRVLGRRILEIVAPAAADEVERRLLEEEERRALDRTRLDFRRHGDGTTGINSQLPDLEADILRKAIDALTSPRRDGADEESLEGLTASQRRGRAFATLIRNLPVDGLPDHGGSPVQIIVTIEWDKLREDVGAATLDTGDRLSVSAVRRLACQQGVLPAVLDGEPEVLDLGRKARLFTPAQRRAHAIEHPTCQAEGCDHPAAWCEAHHRRDPWAHGGTTNLDDLAFLCPFHHHRAHDPHYTVQWSPSGTAKYRRRE